MGGREGGPPHIPTPSFRPPSTTPEKKRENSDPSLTTVSDPPIFRILTPARMGGRDIAPTPSDPRKMGGRGVGGRIPTPEVPTPLFSRNHIRISEVFCGTYTNKVTPLRSARSPNNAGEGGTAFPRETSEIFWEGGVVLLRGGRRVGGRGSGEGLGVGFLSEAMPRGGGGQGQGG